VLLAGALIAAVATGCGAGHTRDPGAVAWPAPPSDRVLQLITAAGLVPETRESLQYHVHAHLDVYIDGRHSTVPAGIGIVTTDPGVQHGVFDGQPTFGGIKLCAQPCISPLHTHDVTGVLHTESATLADNTLGQLFREWDVRLAPDCVGQYCAARTPVAVYVDGNQVPLGDAPRIALADQREIAIVIGRPPAHIPARP
jgi:hypothetical protein